MNQSDDEITLTVVEIDGEPWWQACAGELCVRDRCGARAQELLRQAQLNSQPQPFDGPGLSQRGLSPLNE